MPQSGEDVPAADELVRQVAHDLRQPVAAIMALVSAAAAEAAAPIRLHQRLEQIAGQASWMSKIISDLLAGDGAVVAAERVEMCALVREVVASERLTYSGPIVLRQAGAEPRYVIASRMRLRRAIANVLGNATRAAGHDGHVELVQRSLRDIELVEIVDDGPGFGGLGQDHGIGLRAARRVLAECGGRMEHERLASSHTVVRLLLPIASAQPRVGAR